MSVYVGIDVHRKRSQVAVINEGGEVLANRNVPNGVKPVLSVIGGLPAGTPAAYEAAFGWGWLLELLEGYGFEPHMARPLQCKAIASARLKNDKVDAATLAQLLRADLLPEAWIAPLEVRQLRAMLRHRAQLVRLRTLLRNRVHAVLAGHGHGRPAGCWSGPGRAWLAALELPAVSREVTDDDLALTGALQAPMAGWTRRCASGRRPTRGSRRSPGCPAWARSPRWSCSPRSATSPASARPASSRPGRGSPRRCAAATARSPRAHLRAGADLGAVGGVRGRADGQAAPGLRPRV